MVDGDPGRSGGSSIDPADPRVALANERTFLAYLRTALGLLAAGVAVLELLPRGQVPAGAALGIALVVLGAGLGAAGLGRWARADAALRRGQALPHTHLPAIVGVGFVATSVVVVLVVVMRAVR